MHNYFAVSKSISRRLPIVKEDYKTNACFAKKDNSYIVISMIIIVIIIIMMMMMMMTMMI